MVTHPSTNLYFCCLPSNSLHSIILPLSYWYSSQFNKINGKISPSCSQSWSWQNGPWIFQIFKWFDHFSNVMHIRFYWICTGAIFRLEGQFCTMFWPYIQSGIVETFCLSLNELNGSRNHWFIMQFCFSFFLLVLSPMIPPLFSSSASIQPQL